LAEVEPRRGETGCRPGGPEAELATYFVGHQITLAARSLIVVISVIRNRPNGGDIANQGMGTSCDIAKSDTWHPARRHRYTSIKVGQRTVGFIPPVSQCGGETHRPRKQRIVASYLRVRDSGLAQGFRRVPTVKVKGRRRHEGTR
jgi:hypothetical protein